MKYDHLITKPNTSLGTMSAEHDFGRGERGQTDGQTDRKTDATVDRDRFFVGVAR